MFLIRPKEITTQEIVKTTVAQPPKEVPLILQKIGWCESRNRQFNQDGSVRRGVVNPQDVGKYQINEFYHLEASIKLKMDIYTEEGNTAYALHLYETQGTRPWNWSSGCWKNELTLEELKKK